MANGRNGRHIRLHCSATYIDNQCKPKFSRQILAPNPSHVSQGAPSSPTLQSRLLYSLMPIKKTTGYMLGVRGFLAV